MLNPRLEDSMDSMEEIMRSYEQPACHPDLHGSYCYPPSSGYGHYPVDLLMARHGAPYVGHLMEMLHAMDLQERRPVWSDRRIRGNYFRDRPVPPWLRFLEDDFLYPSEDELFYLSDDSDESGSYVRRRPKRRRESCGDAGRDSGMFQGHMGGRSLRRWQRRHRRRNMDNDCRRYWEQ